jgi:hypothetical protein
LRNRKSQRINEPLHNSTRYERRKNDKKAQLTITTKENTGMNN